MQNIYVFDMGGVIKESFNLEKFYLKIGTKIEFKDFKKYWDENILVAEIGNITSDEFIYRILQYSLSTKTIEEAKEIYGECTGTIYEDTMKIIYLIKSKGKKVYLLSNLKQIDFDYLKKKLDINIFDDVFLSYKLGCTKDDKRIFQILIDKLGTSPDNIYFFDDKEENINNAREMGINAYQVNGSVIKQKWTRLQKNGKINI